MVLTSCQGGTAREDQTRRCWQLPRATHNCQRKDKAKIEHACWDQDQDSRGSKSQVLTVASCQGGQRVREGEVCAVHCAVVAAILQGAKARLRGVLPVGLATAPSRGGWCSRGCGHFLSGGLRMQGVVEVVWKFAWSGCRVGLSKRRERVVSMSRAPDLKDSCQEHRVPRPQEHFLGGTKEKVCRWVSCCAMTWLIGLNLSRVWLGACFFPELHL